jgi:two-component system phosphate regulon response regulator PhoB
VTALQKKILIVEDNADLIETLAMTLEHGAFLVKKARSAREAITIAHKESFDLLLLDVCLPDNSGFELCRQLREIPHCSRSAVVFLSAKAEEIDRVIGFEVGADDYIAKPFSVTELILRIKAVLRRHEPVKAQSGTWNFGCLSVDMNLPCVTVENSEIKLTALELRLLQILYERRGRVQSRSELLNAVWKIESYVTTRTVDTHIKRLREKMKAAALYIKTIRGIGYRFLRQDEIARST